MLASVFVELLAASLVPVIDVGVGFQREQILGYICRERFACLGVFQFPVAQRVLYERDVLLWAEQDFKSFPAGEASQSESGGTRRCEVVVGNWLQGVLASGDLPYPRDALIVPLDK